MSAEKLSAHAATAVAPRTSRPLLARRLRRVVLHLALVTVSLVMAIPFLWMIVTSLKTDPDLASYPRGCCRGSGTGTTTRRPSSTPFGTYFRNSLFISLGHTALNLALASMAGYALARIPFRGSTVIFMGVLATMMIPTYTKIVPQYLIAKGIPFFGGNDYLGRGGHGWLDSWWGLIIPGALTPFAIFLFRQFYLSLPRELEEAARIDGMGSSVSTPG